MKDKYFGISPRIARWKLDTPFENWLSFKADKSEFWKKMYVLYYRFFDKEYYNGGLKIIKNIIANNKDQFSNHDEQYIINDMIYCLHRFGLSFENYRAFNLLDKDFDYRNSFIPDKLRYYYCDILNDKKVSHLMTDKYETYKRYRKYYKRSVVCCRTKDDIKLFENFINEFPHFIFKPLCEHSGHGIHIDELDSNNEEKTRNYFYENINKGPFVVEELMVQHPDINVFHPQSINSFRVVTFVLGKEVRIFSVIWRLGVGNSIVDNAGSGGIYASVNPSTGIVKTDARNYKGEHFINHPDTNCQIKDYRLPNWEDAVALVKAMALEVEGTNYISWDLAYTVKGWCMVEANENGDTQVNQTNEEIGLKSQIFALMDKFFELHK